MMPETEVLPFGPGALVVVGFYIVSLLAIGGYAYTKRKDESLGDFFLAGRSMGFAVLILTLYGPPNTAAIRSWGSAGPPTAKGWGSSFPSTL